ncbi:MAG: hypothetical protein HDR83_01925 [Bacteroides sp.]|nr:hypothetical protein [Bacteroides sp.]
MKYFLYALSGIGTLIWSFAFMVGLNFVIDNIAASIVLGVLLFAVLGGCIMLMLLKSGKRDNVSGNTAKAAIAVYAIASVASCVYVNQYIYVESKVKDEIRSEADAQASELLTAYGDDAGSFSEWVLNFKADYRTVLEGRGVTGSTLETRVNEVPEYFLDSEYAQRANQISENLNIVRDNIAGPVWWDIAFNLRYLADNKEMWEDYLTRKSRDLSAFGVSLSDGELYHPRSVHNDFEVYDNLSHIGFSFWSVLVIIVLQLMMLLVYFLCRPDTTMGGRRYQNESVNTLNL